MSLVGRMAEELARRTSRRESVKRLGAGAFGLVAAWATQGPFGSSALAEQCSNKSPYTECNPPYGRYCSDPSEPGGAAANCNGAMCANDCTLDDYYYPGGPKTACWCSATSQDANGEYYYKCCDCQCPGMTPWTRDDGTIDRGCGCRQEVRLTPPPPPPPSGTGNRKRKKRRKKRNRRR